MFVDQKTATLLGKIAMNGLWNGYAALSERIFRTLLLTRADRPGPWIGMAMCFAHAGQYQKGADFMDTYVLPLFAEDPHVRAWHGFLLILAKHAARGKSVLEPLLADPGTPPDVRRMAEKALNN